MNKLFVAITRLNLAEKVGGKTSSPEKIYEGNIGSLFDGLQHNLIEIHISNPQDIVYDGYYNEKLCLPLATVVIRVNDFAVMTWGSRFNYPQNNQIKSEIVRYWMRLTKHVSPPVLVAHPFTLDFQVSPTKVWKYRQREKKDKK